MVEIKSNLRLSEVEILLLVLRVFFNIERHCLSNSLGFMGNTNPLVWFRVLLKKCLGPLAAPMTIEIM